MRAILKKKFCEKVCEFVEEVEADERREVEKVMLNPCEWREATREAGVSYAAPLVRVSMIERPTFCFGSDEVCHPRARVIECFRDLETYGRGAFAAPF